MQIGKPFGLPTPKLPKPSLGGYDALAKKYMALEPSERKESASKDLAVLSEESRAIQSTRAQAHQNAKKGLFTMVGGLGITVATSIASAADLLPGAAGTALRIGGATLTGVGIYSLFRNTNVRDFGGREAVWENRSQRDFLNHVAKSEI